jgi:hypothetical protein
MKPKTRRTPKQAASARQLDRWQRDVAAMVCQLDGANWARPALAVLPELRRRLDRLLRSMRRAERR